MSTWLTEAEYKQSGAAAVGVTLNRAFLKEIKDDHVELRELINRNRIRIKQPSIKANQVLDWLHHLRDELETYFALEEFYGYFKQAAVTNPAVSQSALSLQSEHEELFIDLLKLIDATEQIIYHENNTQLDFVQDGFEQFVAKFELHEQSEMELMMRLCNEEIGVGD